MSKFKVQSASAFAGSASRFAISFALLGAAISPAYAQDETAAVDEDAIVVTGFKAALESAVAEKKKADQVVESVSAEDIGKLPDASIGEAIARLPGLTSQRLFGRSNSIAIRGLSADLSSTTMNGRPQTSTGEQRNVEFDQFPSEIVSRVDVYKSPQASLVHQGLVGTVDIKTIRPLDSGRKIIAFGARGTYADKGKVNAESHDMGFRTSGTYVNQFADDTVGIALSAAYNDDPYQSEEFEAWGYADNGTDKIIGGIKPFGVSSRLKRLAFQGTLQWKLSPNITMTADGFYSHFTDKQIKRGIEFPLAWSGASLSATGVQRSNGLVTAGTFSGVGAIVNNHGYERNSDIFSGGFNTKYEGDDGWSAFFDMGYSKTKRNELSLESNAGTLNNGSKVLDTLAFVTDSQGTHFTSHALDYSNPNVMVLTDALGWGGGSPAGHQEGYYNDRKINDEILSFQTEVAYELGDGLFSKIKTGMSYTDRNKSKTPEEYFLNLAGGATSLVLPATYRLSPTNFSFIGAGNMLSYDPFALLRDGIYVKNANTSKDIPAKAYAVTERLMSIYLQSDLRGTLGSAELTGNVGVIAQNTEQKSTGVVNLATFPASQAKTTRGASYWDVMPSLNLALRFPSDFVIRFAGAREIQRPRMDDLKVAKEYGQNTNTGLISGSGGNPELRPYRAWAADLNFEKYFANKGYVALQLFYKSLDSYIYRTNAPFDFSGLPITLSVPLPTAIGTLTRPLNGTGGQLYGVEVAGTLPFEVLTSALDGFGVTGGVGYTETSIKPGPTALAEDMPDYSKWVANGTIFFEKFGFNARASARYRSSFQGEFIGFGGERVLKRALAETVIDAQIGYDFQNAGALSGLSIFLQGQNLTNEPFASIVSGQPMQIMNYQTYGRRFMAGFNYKF